jgi:hypothetical protein
MVSTALHEHAYATKHGLWRELDALGEDRVRLRLAEGAYRDTTRLWVEEWLHEQTLKRSAVYDLYKVPDTYRTLPSTGFREPLYIERIERRDDKTATVAATASTIAAFMATIAATVSVVTAVQP